MTLNGAIMQLVEMRENSMMPDLFKPYFNKVIETISECVEPSEITHCAECVHWKHSAVRKSYCEVFDWVNTAEDFCSFAEREEA